MTKNDILSETMNYSMLFFIINKLTISLLGFYINISLIPPASIYQGGTNILKSHSPTGLYRCTTGCQCCCKLLQKVVPYSRVVLVRALVPTLQQKQKLKWLVIQIRYGRGLTAYSNQQLHHSLRTTHTYASNFHDVCGCAKISLITIFNKTLSSHQRMGC